jgi:hypothetical protein
MPPKKAAVRIPFPDKQAADDFLWDRHFDADGKVIPGHSMALYDHEPWKTALKKFVTKLKPIPDFQQMKATAMRQYQVGAAKAELMVAEANLAYFEPEWEAFLSTYKAKPAAAKKKKKPAAAKPKAKPKAAAKKKKKPAAKAKPKKK